MRLSSSSSREEERPFFHEKSDDDGDENRLLLLLRQREKDATNHWQATSKNKKHQHHVLSRQVMFALLVCSFCCFLCCASTFDVLRELTSWSPPSTNVDELPAVFSSSSSSRLIATASTSLPASSSSRPHHRHSKEGENSNSTRWTIFYNIYIRPNSTEDDWQATLAILEDQLAQVGNSYATTTTSIHQNNNALIDLYYNTIGSPRLVPPPSSNNSIPSSLSSNSSSWLYFDRLCRRNHLHCHHMQHYDQGFESKTLLEAHRYCRRRNHHHHHADHVVIYLHNKGSFHHHSSNNDATTHNMGGGNGSDSSSSNSTAYSGQDQWRRAMTAAATSQQCLESLMMRGDDGKNRNNVHVCDACGLLFQPLPYEHYPGNIWSARCSYIQRLINPFALRQERAALMERLFFSSKQRQLLQFQQQQQSQNRTFPNEKQKNAISQSASLQSVPPPQVLQANLFPLANAMTGGDRYLSEFWLASHPWFRPCDLSKNISLQYWKEHDVPTTRTASSSSSLVDAWELHSGPRGSILDAGWEYFKYMNLNATGLLLQYSTATADMGDDNDSLRRRRHHQEFFLLPGRLLKWMFIYNTTPSKDSWVWSWFPHGHEWKKIVAVDDHEEDDNIMHHATSLLVSTANTTTTTMTMANNSKHHNETLQRFQEYYEEVIMDGAAKYQ